VSVSAHFGLPWVCPSDNRGKCYMDGKRIQSLSNASQHVPIYLQLFTSNSTRKFKSPPFKHIMASPVYAPWTIVVDVTWIERGFNACHSIPIYLQPFTSYSEILVGNCNFFLPLAFNAPIGGVPIGISRKSLVLRKLESWGYQSVKTV